MKLGKTEIAKLQAIRGGPISSSELGERFSNSMGLSTLLKKGLITLNDGIYKITELGREICPNRVKNMPPAVKSVTKKQPASLVTVAAAPPIPTTLKTESENDMSNKKTETPTALLMLQCIGAYPDLTMPEIAKLIGKDCKPSYIPSYIERGHVLIELNDNQKKTYRLADGMTAQQVYDYKYTQKALDLKEKIANRTTTMSGTELKNQADQMQVEIARQMKNSVHAAISSNFPDFTVVNNLPSNVDDLKKSTASSEDKDYVVNVSSASEMLNAVNKMCAQATIEMLGEHAHLVLNPKVDVQTGSPKPDEAPKRPKIRFAITSENTLIIQNASFSDIELSQQDTAALVEFIESASLILPVDSGFSLGGKAL